MARQPSVPRGGRLSRRPGPAAAVAVAAGAGVAVDALVPGVRDWLYHHSFTNAVLVGVLLISATYLVVERALEDRERARWTEAARPLLEALAIAGAATDGEVRARAWASAAGPQPQTDWLSQLLERYLGVLTGTPELIEHWHAALSLAQHARVTGTAGGAAPGGTATPDTAYEAAWDRFRAVFSDVHDFGATAEGPGATWAAIPAVPVR